MKISQFAPGFMIPIVPQGEGLRLEDISLIKQCINFAVTQSKKKYFVWLDQIQGHPYFSTLMGLRSGMEADAAALKTILDTLVTGFRTNFSDKPQYFPLAQLQRRFEQVTSPEFLDKQNKQKERQRVGKVSFFDVVRRGSFHTTYRIAWTPPDEGIAETIATAFGPRFRRNQRELDDLRQEDLQALSSIFTVKGYNDKLIREFKLEEQNQQKQVLSSRIPFHLQVLENEGGFHLSIPLDENFGSLSSGPGYDFMQIVEPFFLRLSKPKLPDKQYVSKRAKEIDPTSYYYLGGSDMLLKASHGVYETLRYLLEMKGFDTSELQRAMYTLLPKREDFKRGRMIPGQLTGYFINKAQEYLPYGESLENIGLRSNLPKPDPQDEDALKAYYSDITSVAKQLVGGHPKDGREWFSAEQATQNVIRMFPGLQPDQALELVEQIKNLLSGWVNALRHTGQKFVGGKREAFDGTFWWDMMQYTLRKPGEPEAKIKPLQGKDIMWLYSQPSGILGDEAGSGKTIQAIIAADMRTRSGGKHPLLKISKFNDQGFPEYVKVNSSGKELGENDPQVNSTIRNGQGVVGSANHKRSFDPATKQFYQPDGMSSEQPIGGGKVLVFTVNNVVGQFADEILYTTGIDPDLVATSIEDMVAKGVDKVKWLVLPYSSLNKNTEAQQIRENERLGENDPDYIRDMVSPGGGRAQTVAATVAFIKSVDFDVLILDECHKAKNPGSGTAKNLYDISQTVPYKWGLTATYAANRPEDLQHQAKVLGHPIGNYKFGMEGLGGSSDVTHPKKFLSIVKRMEPDFASLPIRDQIEFAINFAETTPVDDEGNTLKARSDEQVAKVTYVNALVILTDFYHRKTKQEIVRSAGGELPKHEIHTELISPDQNLDIEDAIRFHTQRLKAENDAKREREGKPPTNNTEVFERQAVAIAKVPEAVKLAKSLLDQGQKVMIFSAYVEPAKQIHQQLEALLAPKGQAAFISTGDTKSKQKAEERKLQIQIFKSKSEQRNQNNWPDARAYVFMIQSSGTGMDMPNVVQHVIVNDYTYVPADFDQVEGRADRVSRISELHTHYMVVDDSLDKTIFLRTNKKRDLSNRAQNIDMAYAEKLRKNEPVGSELEQARETHWELVKENIVAEIIHENMQETADQLVLASSNWLSKRAGLLGLFSSKRI